MNLFVKLSQSNSYGEKCKKQWEQKTASVLTVVKLEPKLDSFPHYFLRKKFILKYEFKVYQINDWQNVQMILFCITCE